MAVSLTEPHVKVLVPSRQLLLLLLLLSEALCLLASRVPSRVRTLKEVMTEQEALVGQRPGQVQHLFRPVAKALLQVSLCSLMPFPSDFCHDSLRLAPIVRSQKRVGSALL